MAATGAGVAGLTTLNLVPVVLWVFVASKGLRRNRALRDGGA